MGLVSGLAVYTIIWWTVLFAVLPFGTRPNPEGDALSGWRGAPQRPLILRAMVVTTVVSAVLWVGVDAIVRSDWLSFRTGWLALPEK
jgi:predicted secreted protein